jgi:putative membrane protein
VIIARARLWAAHAAYAEHDGLIAVRRGWLNRSWRFADVSKLQTIQLSETPFDRRHGMATVWLDTAGARSRDGALRIPFLPAREARALFDRLSAGMDRRVS